jgi:hypothetical protein
MGIECINTTPTLFKGGEVMVYRMPTPEPNQKYTGYFFGLGSSFKREKLEKLRQNEDFRNEEKELHFQLKGLGKRNRKKVMRQPGWMEKRASMVTEFRKRWGLDEDTIGEEIRKERRKSGPTGPEAFFIERQMYSSTYAMPCPPGNPASAKNLGGSLQWEAEKGAYCVATFNTLDNPAKLPEPQQVVCWTDVVDNDGGSGLGVTTEWTQWPTSFPSTQMFSDTQFVAPFNISGIYFFGLPKETVISVNVNYYIERFPDPQEDDLVVLASPSPSFDDTAMRIYAGAMRKLPVGVPQGMNPLGEWFNSVVNSVAKVVSPALHAAGVVTPWMSGLGWVADSVAAATEPTPGGGKPRKPRRAGAPVPQANQARRRKQTGKQNQKAPPSGAKPRNPPPKKKQRKPPPVNYASKPSMHV